jgi:hypothetical protein
MLNTVRAIVKEGKIELLEEMDIPEGTEVLVTSLIDETDFWSKVSRPAVDAVWDLEATKPLRFLSPQFVGAAADYQSGTKLPHSTGFADLIYAQA